MRKSTIALLILSIFAVLIAGCATKTANTEVAKQTQLVELADEEPVLPAESGTVPENPAPVVHVLEVSLEDYYETTSNCFLKGEVTLDAKPLETSFDIYCAGSNVGSKSSDAAGAFDFSVSKADCPEGVDAWVEADGKKSPTVKVHYAADSGSGAANVQTLSLSSTSGPAGVPEFSIMTLGLAVVIGGLGLAYLRKN